jgi:hypothetical protein
MEEYENLHEKIQEMMGKNPGNLKVMEEQVDIDGPSVPANITLAAEIGFDT